MAVYLSSFSWWLWGGREKEAVSNGSALNSSMDWGMGVREVDIVNFSSVNKAKITSSSRKAKRKWQSREERRRRIDKEYDVVLVPSDGVGLSGSESDNSDWSIGWTEPHAPDFRRDDDDGDDSFAVLVPCYRHDCKELNKGPKSHQFFSAINNLPNDYADGQKYVEQWLSSLQYC